MMIDADELRALRAIASAARAVLAGGYTMPRESAEPLREALAEFARVCRHCMHATVAGRAVCCKCGGEVTS